MVCCVLRTVSYTGHTESDSFKPVTGKFIIRTVSDFAVYLCIWLHKTLRQTHNSSSNLTGVFSLCGCCFVVHHRCIIHQVHRA